MQHGFAAADHQRMACVVTSLEAHDMRGLFGQQVDDLALAFITPLGAQNYYTLAHLIHQTLYLLLLFIGLKRLPL